MHSGEPEGKVPLAEAEPHRARSPRAAGRGEAVPLPQRGLARVRRRLAGGVRPHARGEGQGEGGGPLCVAALALGVFHDDAQPEEQVRRSFFLCLFCCAADRRLVFV